jgi:large subunit ribosomal protein L19
MKSPVASGIVISPVNMQERASLGVRAGDTVKVWQKITEEVTEGKTTKMKSRLQIFEGLVISTKHGSEAGASFTVRKVASGVGVEKSYPLYSTAIDKIEIVRRSKVRRAKLYFIRDTVSREMKRALRKMKMMGTSTRGEAELAIEAAALAAVEAAEAEKIAAEEARVAAEKAAHDAEVASRQAEIDAEEAAREAATVPTEESSEVATETTENTEQRETSDSAENPESPEEKKEATA